VKNPAFGFGSMRADRDGRGKAEREEMDRERERRVEDGVGDERVGRRGRQKTSRRAKLA